MLIVERKFLTIVSQSSTDKKMNTFATIVLIATGEYNKYLDNLIQDIHKFFLPHKSKRVVVFTDQERSNFILSPGDIDYRASMESGSVEFFNIDNETTEVYFNKVKDYGWPWMTMSRYALMLADKGVWASDYVFYLDVDTKFYSVVGEEVLGKLVAVEHYGYYNAGYGAKPFEKREESFAHTYKRERYYIGAFQGGTSDRYKDACMVLSDSIFADTANGVIAVWHDESHWNAYLNDGVEFDELHVMNPYYYCYSNSKVHTRKAYWHGVFHSCVMGTIPKSDLEMGKEQIKGCHVDDVYKLSQPISQEMGSPPKVVEPKVCPPVLKDIPPPRPPQGYREDNLI